ncbi:hypothetical protein E2C01_044902 [Portunus trituberculatus]|uniref:Uncharacterized protein n=1 Tax=Portunus trituberculatus TaxID=210409 RepID=A0A5B7G0L4_PORTR|nr:hypothetical protein [Portunus trituberculatus]
MAIAVTLFTLFPSFRRNLQVHGLGCSNHGDGKQHVIANLHRLSVANLTAVDNVLPHGREQHLGCLKLLLLSSDHEGESSTFGCIDAARHRGIHEDGSFLARQACHLLGHSGVDGAAVQDECARLYRPVERDTHLL